MSDNNEWFKKFMGMYSSKWELYLWLVLSIGLVVLLLLVV